VNELWSWLRNALLGALASVLLWALAERLWADARRRRRQRRAQAGEREALRLLRAAGFEVVEAQVGRELTLEIDGAPAAYRVRVDFLVHDRGQRLFVAEVKTGALATQPLHRPTRRQLLEYQLGFPEASGVLLVDMELRLVRRVRFLGGRPPQA